MDQRLRGLAQDLIPAAQPLILTTAAAQFGPKLRDGGRKFTAAQTARRHDRNPAAHPDPTRSRATQQTLRDRDPCAMGPLLYLAMSAKTSRDAEVRLLFQCPSLPLHGIELVKLVELSLDALGIASAFLVVVQLNGFYPCRAGLLLLAESG